MDLSQGQLNTSSDFIGDKLHFNPEGNDKLARLVLAEYAVLARRAAERAEAEAEAARSALPPASSLPPTTQSMDTHTPSTSPSSFGTIPNDWVFTHSPTGHSVGFSREEHVAVAPVPAMVEYNMAIAAEWAKKPLAECVTITPAVNFREKAASVLEQLLLRQSFCSDGIRWTARQAELGNLLEVDSTQCTGFDDYEGVLGEARLSIEQARRRQRNSTLRILRTGYKKMVQKRDRLREREGLGIEDLDALLHSNRRGAAFVIACIYLLEEMADGAELVDLHFVNSASSLAAFGFHIDDHAEQDQGRPKRYIDRSVPAPPHEPAWRGSRHVEARGLLCGAAGGACCNKGMRARGYESMA